MKNLRGMIAAALLLSACGCVSGVGAKSDFSEAVLLSMTFSVDPESEGDISVDNSSLVFRIVNNGEKEIRVPVERPLRIVVVNGCYPNMHCDNFFPKTIRIGPGQSLLVIGFTFRDYYFYYSQISPHSNNVIQAQLLYWCDDLEGLQTLDKSFKFHIEGEEKKGEEGDLVPDRKMPVPVASNLKPHTIDLYLLDAKGNIVRHFRVKPNEMAREWRIAESEGR